MADLYRKKPVTVEVMGPITTDSIQEIAIWCNGFITSTNPFCDGGIAIVIPTLEGNMDATLGDFIIRGVQGEFYPCKPDIFAQTYEIAETRHG